jgi:hypothetical protein
VQNSGQPRLASSGKPPPALEVPPRKRQRIEIGDRGARRHPARDVAGRQAHDAGLRFAVEHEVAVPLEELRHLRRGDADEADGHTACARGVGPGDFRPVIDDRRQHQRDIGAVEGSGAAAGAHHVVGGAAETRRRVGEMDARQIVVLLLQARDDAGDAGERLEP